MSHFFPFFSSGKVQVDPPLHAQAYRSADSASACTLMTSSAARHHQLHQTQRGRAEHWSREMNRHKLTMTRRFSSHTYFKRIHKPPHCPTNLQTQSESRKPNQSSNSPRSFPTTTALLSRPFYEPREARSLSPPPYTLRSSVAANRWSALLTSSSFPTRISLDPFTSQQTAG